MNAMLKLSFLIATSGVQVLYRRSSQGLSSEPPRLQISTEGSSSDGWIPIANSSVAETTFFEPSACCQRVEESLGMLRAERIDLEGDVTPEAALDAIVLYAGGEAFHADPDAAPDAIVPFEAIVPYAGGEAFHADPDAAPYAIVPFEGGEVVENAADGPPQANRRDQRWTRVGEYPRHGTEATPETLRAAAYRILDVENVQTSSPANSGRFAVIASCNRCGISCTLQWRFSFVSDRMVLAQKRGEHCNISSVAIHPTASKRRKLDIAKKYKKHTPQRALRQMEDDEIRVEDRPLERQLEWVRRPVQAGPSRYPTELRGLLERFVDSPPECVHIIKEHVVITETELRVPFVASLVWEDAAAFADLPCFLMNYTFNTNKHGLLLGSCGPCGLQTMGTSQLPRVKFIPAIFCISSSEDEKAHLILLELYEAWRAKCTASKPITDGFLDYRCLTSAAAHFRGRKVYLHRCLQHVKTDIQKEARHKDSVTGLIRINSLEFLPVLVEWVEWSAFLPRDEEFQSFWLEAFERMEATILETDFRERRMAQYLKDCIFDTSGGHVRASWTSGLDAVPLGYTTYAANSCERNHRTLKDLLDLPYEGRGLGDLMVQLCTIMNSRMRTKFYSEVQAAILEAPAILYEAQRKRTVTVVDEESEGRCGRVQDLVTIVGHYKKYGAKGTYLAVPCRRAFASGLVASLVYVFPTYKLIRAVECLDDMRRMLKLVLAKTVSEIREACYSPKKTYDMQLHIRMRRMYTAVFWVDSQKIAIDEHKDFGVNAGHSGHAMFVKRLHTKGYFDDLPRGPSSHKAKGDRNQRYSDKLRRMLQAPEGVAGEALPVAEESDAMENDQAGAGASIQCIAKTRKGDRCTKRRVGEQYCSTHEKLFDADKHIDKIKATFAKSVKHCLAPTALEKWELQQALQASLEEDLAQKEKVLDSQSVIYGRLCMLNLRPILTEALGNCFFIAVVETAGLPITAYMLRQQICDYVKHNAGFFTACFTDGDAGLERYVAHMRDDGVWATAIEVSAAAHALMRPLHLITEHPDTDAAATIVEPPDMISPSAWGPPLYLAHFLEWHFEGTVGNVA